MTAHLEQRSPEWFAARKGKITGSRVGGILGVNPYATPEQVMRDMVREWFDAPSEFTGNEATEHGTKMEPEAAAWYRDHMMNPGETLRDVGMIPHPTLDFIGASPDGLIDDADGKLVGGLEIKCPYPPYHRRGGYRPYSILSKPSYAAQMQLVMECCDIEWMDFLCYFDADNNLVELVKRDRDWWENARPKLEEFHARFTKIVKNKKLAAPYLADPVPVIADARMSRLSDLFFAIKNAEAQIKEDKAEFDQLKKELAGEFKVGMGEGIRFATITKRGAIDYGEIIDLLGVEAILHGQGKTLDDFRKPDTFSITVEAADA